MNKLYQFDEVFDTQSVFRKLLKAMSYPGEQVSVTEEKEKLFGNYPALLAAAMTLLDNEVTFAAMGNSELSHDIRLVTLSQETEPDKADYLFVTKAEQLSDAFASAKCGTLTDPHTSATIIIRDNEALCKALCLSGPGIDGVREYACSELLCEAIAARDNQVYEYPQGVDMIFISDSGRIMAVPRLVKRRETNGICCSIRR